MSEQGDSLTGKQRLFALHYVGCLNRTEAAARAGYAGDRATLAQIGYENLRKPEIRAEVERLMTAQTVPPAEILGRLSAIARADLGDFFVLSGRGVSLDLKQAKALGLMPLVKKYTKTKQGVSIELHSAPEALAKLGEHYKLWTTRLDIDANVTERIAVAATETDRALARLAGAGGGAAVSGEPEPGGQG